VSAVANLYLDRKGAEAREENGVLCIRVPGCQPYTVPLKLVDHVVAASNIACDTGTLQRSAAAGIGWILLHPRHAPCFVNRCAWARDPRRRIAQIRAVSSGPFCARMQKRLIATKLFLQAAFLRRAAGARNDVRAELCKGAARLECAAKGLRDGDASASADNTAWLLGVEGAAANAFFAAFGQLFAPSLRFAGRNRRPPRDPVNVCLSLGYTLIHAEAVRASALAGLEPGLGFLHQPEPGRDSLACDLVETERASIEEFAYSAFRDRILRPEHFRWPLAAKASPEGVPCLIGKAGRQAFYESVEPVLEAARRRLRRRAEHLGRLVERFAK
jgi:CRISPR-associated protein Cas1